MTHFYKTTKTPVGNLKLVASNNGLAAILCENDNLKRFSFAKLEENKTNLILLKWEKQLQEYFAGKRKSFDIDLDLAGTDFQKKFGRYYLQFHLVKPEVTLKLPLKLATQKPRAPSAPLLEKSNCNYCALSSRYRFVRKINRFCRWIRSESFFAGA